MNERQVLALLGVLATTAAFGFAVYALYKSFTNYVAPPS